MAATEGLPVLSRTVTRDEAIAALRRKLLDMTDEEHSMCEVASRHGLLCRGFAQWDDAEFRTRFDEVARRRPLAGRGQLEQLANTWQLARQIVEQVPLACDLSPAEHRVCMGWDGFTDEDLARYCLEILGEPLAIRG